MIAGLSLVALLAVHQAPQSEWRHFALSAAVTSSATGGALFSGSLNGSGTPQTVPWVGPVWSYRGELELELPFGFGVGVSGMYLPVAYLLKPDSVWAFGGQLKYQLLRGHRVAPFAAVLIGQRGFYYEGNTDSHAAPISPLAIVPTVGFDAPITDTVHFRAQVTWLHEAFRIDEDHCPCWSSDSFMPLQLGFVWRLPL